MLASLVSLACLAAPSGSTEPAAGQAGQVERATPKVSALTRYLQRDVAPSARFLDHGVLGFAAAGGWPHRYALRMQLGVLDHLTLGGQAHWLPGQSRPAFSPEVAVAAVRLRWVDAGVLYKQTLYPPPEVDGDPETPSFEERDHWILSTVSFSNHWLSAGFDFGLNRARVNDPGMDPANPDMNPSVIRWRLGGGLHLRAGTRRWGFTANVMAPRMMAELAFDVRFGLFEKRGRGGWKPSGIVYSTDRRVPQWR